MVYQRFNCGTQKLEPPVTVSPKKLTVVEGAYSAHPAFGKYANLAVFLDIDPEYQRKRIFIRNTPQFAERFFNEWIPLEKRYFEATEIQKRSDMIIPVIENN